MKKPIKIILRIFGVALLVLLLAFLGLSWYVSSHKKELLARVTAEASKLIGGKVTIEDVSVSLLNNFPSLSIQLKKIDVRDSMFANHGHSLFHAEKLFVRVNPIKLIIAKVSINKLEIDSGSFYLFTDSSSYTNTYLLKPKQKDHPSGKSSKLTDLIRKIELRHFSVIQSDIQKDKLFDLYIDRFAADMKTVDGSYVIDIKETILINSFAFKKNTGSYAENRVFEGDFIVNFNPVSHQLAFDSIAVSISKQPFRLTGLFKLGKEQDFFLRVNTKNMLLDFGKSLLTKKTAKGIGLVSVTAPLDVSAIGGD
ncbi:MAG: hypothetical protein ABI581_17090, partial [Sediminibacterium sp.]